MKKMSKEQNKKQTTTDITTKYFADGWELII